MKYPLDPTAGDFEPTFSGEFRPAITDKRCPKCRATNLVFCEVTEELTTWSVRDGKLNFQNGFHTPGSIIEFRAECSDCGHGWKPRGAQMITDVITELDPKTFKPI